MPFNPDLLDGLRSGRTRIEFIQSLTFNIQSAAKTFPATKTDFFAEHSQKFVERFAAIFWVNRRSKTPINASKQEMKAKSLITIILSIVINYNKKCNKFIEMFTLFIGDRLVVMGMGGEGGWGWMWVDR